MVRRKARMTTVILMIFALLIGAASLARAATPNDQQPGAMHYDWDGHGGNWCGHGGWGNGTGWCNGRWGGHAGKHGSQFMAHGRIVSMDTAASSITVTLDDASSKLLSKVGLTRADLPEDVTLTTKSTVKIWGCGWHNQQWGSGKQSLSNLSKGDVVNLMGYFDPASGDPVVAYINVWYY